MLGDFEKVIRWKRTRWLYKWVIFLDSDFQMQLSYSDTFTTCK